MLLLALCACGTYKGWQFMTGRNEWFDRREPAGIAVKVLCLLLSP